MILAEIDFWDAETTGIRTLCLCESGGGPGISPPGGKTAQYLPRIMGDGQGSVTISRSLSVDQYGTASPRAIPVAGNLVVALDAILYPWLARNVIGWGVRLFEGDRSGIMQIYAGKIG